MTAAPLSAVSLFDGRPEWSDVAVVLGLAFVIAYVTSAVIGRLVRAALTAIYSGHEDVGRLIRRPVLVARLVTLLLAFPVAAFPLLDAIGQRYEVGLDQNAALHWVLSAGLRIALVITIAWLVVRIVVHSTRRLERHLVDGGAISSSDRVRRAQTLGALLRNIAVTLVGIVTLLMVLRELNVDILPMLTGAGIAGVALGFGAQWLVRDLIAGFFLILEDQVRVGDSVVINGQGGGVESINQRTIVLRDVEGAVHIFQNGAITTLANRTRDFAFYLIDVSVDFRQDTDKVVDVLRDTASALQQDPALGPYILEPLEVLGVDSFRDGQVSIRSRIKTQPQKQWEVGRELRRRLRYALQDAGIDIAPAALHSVLRLRED